MGEEDKFIQERLEEMLRRHCQRDHGPRSVGASELKKGLESITLQVYTDATRPAAATAGAGAVIYNSTDNGLNVSDGTNWRAPNGGWAVT